MSLEAPLNGPLTLDDYEGVWIHSQDLDAFISRIHGLLQTAQCGCSIKERDSGHLVDCWMPVLKEDAQALIADLSSIAAPVDGKLEARRAQLLPETEVPELELGGEG